jgi:hypothetical protein
MATTPKIAWGASFANTWQWPGAADDPLPLSIPRGAEGESEDGTTTFWETRVDEELALTARFIPKADAGSVTGYSTTTTGVREALLWMQTGSASGKNQFRFYPDSTSGTYHTCILVGEPEASRDEGGARYRVRLRMRDVDGTAFTEY